MKVSEISFGCWTMGGLNWVNGSDNGWANVDEDEVTAGIKARSDAGVNHFDNADVYGSGKADRTLARVQDKLGVKTQSVIIATKIGHFPGTAEHAYTPAHIRHQCHQSLINLNRDYIDVYYFLLGDFGKNAAHLPSAETLDALVSGAVQCCRRRQAYVGPGREIRAGNPRLTAAAGSAAYDRATFRSCRSPIRSRDAQRR